MSTKVFYRGAVLTLSVLPVMTLAACGDGWVPQPYEGVPYTYERTAGRGVEYVRASMAPAKEMKTETIMHKEAPVSAPVSAPPPPMSTGDKVFNTKQAK
jgi:hypothetical protein